MTVTMRWIYTALLSILITMTPAETKDNTRPEQKVRPASQAGRFYDSDAASLAHEVDSLLARHANMDGYADVAALIVPHAGYYFSGNVAAAAYSALDPQRRYKAVAKTATGFYKIQPRPWVKRVSTFFKKQEQFGMQSSPVFIEGIINLTILETIKQETIDKWGYIPYNRAENTGGYNYADNLSFLRNHHRYVLAQQGAQPAAHPCDHAGF